MRETIGGVLLAGGLGRRMGGADKPLVSLAGRPLIHRAARRLAPQVATLLINANGDPQRFSSLALPVVADESRDYPGPLAGVLAALQWFTNKDPAINAVASLPADVPFAPQDLVTRLAVALATSPTAGVAVAQSRGQRHHVVGLWRVEAADEIAAALADGQRRAATMGDRLNAVEVSFPDVVIDGHTFDPFFNINTPDDLALAETILAHTDSPPPCGEGSRVGGTPTFDVQNSPPPRPSPTRGEGEGHGQAPFVVGIAGWKNAGKTTLVAALVRELTRRGYRVSTVKHSHHDIASEADGTDTSRHRNAGAYEVALVSPTSWGVLPELHREPEPPLTSVLSALGPVDIVIVEGMKRAPIPKIEIRRTGQGQGPPLAGTDPDVFAIATDHDVADTHVSVLALDDIAAISHTLLSKAGLPEQMPAP